MINPQDNLIQPSYISKLNYSKNSYTPTPHYPFLERKDSIELSTKESPLHLIRSGNAIHINFAGTLKNPEQPAIQMKVRSVSRHQKNTAGGSQNAKDDNIVKLADSNWKDGQKLNFEIKKVNKSNYLILKDPKYGEIGRVPDEISTPVIKLIKGREKDFRFELSNVIAGTSKGAATIGLRANLKYIGKDEKVRQKTERTFNYLLNTDDSDIKECIMPYQPKASPKEVLNRIFDIESQRNGSQTKADIEEAIETISDEINNPNNKNILLIGHCLPDGDTLGCILGMQAAIKGAYPDKNVECSVDDKIPGLFRDTLPGIKEVKRPFNEEKVEELEQNIAELRTQKNTKENYEKRRVLEKELAELKKSRNMFDPATQKGAEAKKYDLVMLMDIPTPKRFSGAFKDYIENAEKVIYIDHHPYQYSEWQDSKEVTGVDMDKIKKNNLSLVCPSVPSATQLVTVIADQAGILDKTMKSSLENAKQFVAAIITGTSTDTGSFIRAANLTTDDIQKPVNERPNFLPEGMSKWLIERLGHGVDKKWLREHIVYDIPDKAINLQETSAREKMVQYAIKSQQVFPSNGIGFISMDYDQMYEVWKDAQKVDKNTTLLDVQNSLKYSEAMGALRDAPKPQDKYDNGLNNEKKIIPYSSPYEDDKIAVLLIQDKKSGQVDENSQIAEQNGIRISFRSKEGTDYAELLGNLFGGGGHGSAAGGRIDLEGVTLDSKIVAKINGKQSKDAQQIYETLKYNHEIMNNSKIPVAKKKAMCKKIDIEISSKGKNIQNFINDIAHEMRLDSDKNKY